MFHIYIYIYIYSAFICKSIGVDGFEMEMLHCGVSGGLAKLEEVKFAA